MPSSEWETIRRTVALFGHVLDADGKPKPGVRVTITKAPPNFRLRGKTKTTTPETHWLSKDQTSRRDSVVTRSDGIYFFLDLPDGNYTMEAEDAQGRHRGENRGKVSRNKDGKILRAMADIKLLPPKAIA